MAMPNGSATSVDTTRDAQRQLDRGPVLGESSNTRLDAAYDTGLIRKLKPYFSKIALAAGVRRKSR